MTDRNLIKAELQNLQKILEAKADMCIGAGKMKLLSFAKACSGALELLKAQEAVAPYTNEEGTCSCGNCMETVEYYPVGSNEPVELCNFCPNCGKAVKWDD